MRLTTLRSPRRIRCSVELSAQLFILTIELPDFLCGFRQCFMTLRQVNLPICHFTNCLLKLRESLSLLLSVYALQVCLALGRLGVVCVEGHLESMLGVLWVLSGFCAAYLSIVVSTSADCSTLPVVFCQDRLLRRYCTRLPKRISCYTPR
ncbi:hypothetical protein DFJ58DRAFT_799792 [Suillus subalutaceus]|uniref:uncharacterized protein n=1 Tax=Suillus subalutaceus TaxID=48586 RepID=UPI001B870E80|nr:uncharacterized protein DFJ58DRAFT_799792 [Suillus subalutaceus]KAG1846086.1 hypothetical protein DFJ58DRAFT_799792 [Suillus subalutaceus]